MTQFQISPRERTDCEIFYLSHIAKSGLASDDDRHREHPQWDALCKSASDRNGDSYLGILLNPSEHGRPENIVAPKQDKLSNQLISMPSFFYIITTLTTSCERY